MRETRDSLKLSSSKNEDLEAEFGNSRSSNSSRSEVRSPMESSETVSPSIIFLERGS